jgi:hypothetical protein
MKPMLVAVLSVLGLLIMLSIPVLIGFGKYQVCRNYFPEINRVACLFTSLPPVGRK